MLLSDRDIRLEIDAGRIGLDPWQPEMVQPSSVDVRLDRYFRLFDNHKYPFIDPALDQPDLTHLIEVDPAEPFILHPGEFALGSTFELVSLPDDVAARLEGKSSLGRLGLLTHSTAGFIDPAADQPDLTRLVEAAPGEPFVLHPGEFVLGSTYEAVTLPDDIAARLEGKSSLGRLGLLTHSTAGFIDPGFSGHVTLELSNVATLPILLWPGMKIGQMCFFRLSSASEHPYGSSQYGSRYQGQRGPTASRSFQNFHRTDV